MQKRRIAVNPIERGVEIDNVTGNDWPIPVWRLRSDLKGEVAVRQIRPLVSSRPNMDGYGPIGPTRKQTSGDVVFRSYAPIVVAPPPPAWHQKSTLFIRLRLRGQKTACGTFPPVRSWARVGNSGRSTSCLSSAAVAPIADGLTRTKRSVTQEQKLCTHH
jgi:hypothetical protein